MRLQTGWLSCAQSTNFVRPVSHTRLASGILCLLQTGKHNCGIRELLLQHVLRHVTRLMRGMIQQGLMFSVEQGVLQLAVAFYISVLVDQLFFAFHLLICQGQSICL